MSTIALDTIADSVSMSRTMTLFGALPLTPRNGLWGPAIGWLGLGSN